MYTQSITRTHRTAFIFVIDGSGSMAEKIRFRGRLMTKADAVASITNGMLFELIERARRSDGSNALREISTPAWVEPEAVGQTPMCEALRRVRDIAAKWCADPVHAESFPPIVFNITDGEATDCDDEELCAVAEQIKSLRTADGNVLLVNIHIAAGDTPRTVFFPSTEEADYPNRYAAVLYECSSLMPEVFDEAIREAKGPGATPPFRGMSYNASAEQLITMLNIGSISVKTE